MGHRRSREHETQVRGTKRKVAAVLTLNTCAALRDCPLSLGTSLSWKETTQLLEGFPGSREGEREPLTEIS